MRKEFLSIILLCPLMVCAMDCGSKCRDLRRFTKKYNNIFLIRWLQSKSLDPKVIDIDGLKRPKIVTIDGLKRPKIVTIE